MQLLGCANSRSVPSCAVRCKISAKCGKFSRDRFHQRYDTTRSELIDWSIILALARGGDTRTSYATRGFNVEVRK